MTGLEMYAADTAVRAAKVQGVTLLNIEEELELRKLVGRNFNPALTAFEDHELADMKARWNETEEE